MNLGIRSGNSNHLADPEVPNWSTWNRRIQLIAREGRIALLDGGPVWSKIDVKELHLHELRTIPDHDQDNIHQPRDGDRTF